MFFIILHFNLKLGDLLWILSFKMRKKIVQIVLTLSKSMNIKILSDILDSRILYRVNIN